jgi:hypothetical protein
MTADTQFATKGKIRIFGSALLFAGMAFAGTASAVNVNGNLDSINEYANSKQITWWNDHNSVYDLTRSLGDNNWETSVTNALRWETSNSGATLNLFFEIPDYARRMIWQENCKTDGNGCSGSMTDTQAKLDVLEAYDTGSHHDPDNMDYGTQTKSEFFRLNYSGNNPVVATEIHKGTSNTGTDEGGDALVDIGWQSVDDTDDDFNWKTSREYVIANNADCDTTNCYEFDKTAAIELEWNGLGTDVALAIVNSIANMQLHLSDEAHGIVPRDIPGVPVPAAFWLFGTALICFIGFSRRTNLS